MKIFKITFENQTQFVTHVGSIGALKLFCAMTGMDLQMFPDEAEIIEFNNWNWNTIQGNRDSITFQQFMDEHQEPKWITGELKLQP